MPTAQEGRNAADKSARLVFERPIIEKGQNLPYLPPFASICVVVSGRYAG